MRQEKDPRVRTRNPGVRKRIPESGQGFRSQDKDPGDRTRIPESGEGYRR